MYLLLILNLLCVLNLSAQNSESAFNSNTVKVETAASFKGGSQDWQLYLRDNVDTNTPAKNGAPLGIFTVIIRLVVTTEGKISDVVAKTKHGFGMESEAIRVIKSSPDWIPATKNGIPVKSYIRQPVTFAMEMQDLEIRASSAMQVGKENELIVSSNKIPVEFIEFEISNGNGTVSPAGRGKFIFIPAHSGAVLAMMHFNTRRKKMKISAVYFNVL